MVKKRSTLVSALLLLTTVGLTTAAVVLALNPVAGMMMSSKDEQPAAASTHRTSHPAAEPSKRTSVSAPKSANPDQSLKVASGVGAPSSIAKQPSKTITYVVKRGDTLAGIATWFHQHGFGAIYEANRAVIGSDPDLIIPGQRIVVSGDTMTVVR